MMCFFHPQSNPQLEGHIKKIIFDSPNFTMCIQIAIGNARPNLTNASRENKNNDTKKLNYGVVLKTLRVRFPRNHARGARCVF